MPVALKTTAPINWPYERQPNPLTPAKMKTLTHDDLVRNAAAWLAAKCRCSVVMTELVTTGETPDAIGWRGTFSTLVECKVSRSDFMADRQKMFRCEAWAGIGYNRYYLTPPGLVQRSELPPGWGLLELTECGICKLLPSLAFHEVNHSHEIGLLLSCIRCLGHQNPKGVSVRFYTLESKNTATVGVDLSDTTELTPALSTEK